MRRSSYPVNRLRSIHIHLSMRDLTPFHAIGVVLFQKLLPIDPNVALKHFELFDVIEEFVDRSHPLAHRFSKCRPMKSIAILNLTTDETSTARKPPHKREQVAYILRVPT